MENVLFKSRHSLRILAQPSMYYPHPGPVLIKLLEVKVLTFTFSPVTRLRLKADCYIYFS